jgi:hypothetical protein
MNQRITADIEPVLSALREAELLLSEAPECSLEVRDRLLGFLDAGLEVGGVEVVPTLGASETRVVLKLADGFLELVSALRARDIDRRVQV